MHGGKPALSRSAAVMLLGLSACGAPDAIRRVFDDETPEAPPPDPDAPQPLPVQRETISVLIYGAPATREEVVEIVVPPGDDTDTDTDPPKPSGAPR
jgi:hypothetical protein